MIPPATPASGASGNMNSSPVSVPQNRPLTVPLATAWCAGVVTCTLPFSSRQMMAASSGFTR